jgi:hypothetical protein
MPYQVVGALQARERLRKKVGVCDLAPRPHSHATPSSRPRCERPNMARRRQQKEKTMQHSPRSRVDRSLMQGWLLRVPHFQISPGQRGRGDSLRAKQGLWSENEKGNTCEQHCVWGVGDEENQQRLSNDSLPPHRRSTPHFNLLHHTTSKA